MAAPIGSSQICLSPARVFFAMKIDQISTNIDEASAVWVGRHIYSPAQGTLIVDEQLVELEPRVNHLLHFLVEQQGKVVTRDSLITNVWGRIVSDDALNRAISILRRSLAGKSRLHKGYIKTLPKRGYRLDAKVRPYLSSKPIYSKSVRSQLPALFAGSVIAIFAVYGLFVFIKPFVVSWLIG